MGLDIPMLMECYNNMKVGSGVNISMRLDGLDEDKRAGACIGCGQCAHACPQGIDVPSVMRELDEMYVNGPKWADVSKSRHESIRKELNMK